MRRAQIVTLLAIAPLLFTASGASRGEEIKDAGFVFVHPARGRAQLRAEPKGDARVVGVPPTGMRLVYRKRLFEGGRTVWYFVEAPGASPGWLPAEDASDKRPAELPSLKPIRLIDSGIGNSARPVGGMTAAARGLDKRARQYGETQTLKESADQFVTLERNVDDLYQDKQDDNGVYLSEEPSPVRRGQGDSFKASLQREESR